MEAIHCERAGNSAREAAPEGTRIPVGLVLGCLAAGKTAEEIVAEFPELTREQIAACLDYARDVAEV